MFSLFRSAPVNQPVFLYNSATGKKEEFKPLKAGHLTMYSCGPTVYDHIHVGNLRSYLLPDLLTRLFLYNGYKIKSVINFTDFGHLSDDGDDGEDKMVKGMKRDGYEITLENMRTFSEPYIDSFKSDNLVFGNLPPTVYTRASDYVRQQIALIRALEEKGYAYKISDGIYFDISRFPSYGVLGNVDIEKMKAGARVEVNLEKKHPADFALWKFSDLGWESRWGKGFPGWHIECTAMAFAELGKQIDIHTGGEDLKYTHHNGEIAQAESATGKKYVGYWLHNSHVTIDKNKIAKSAGNGIRLKQLADRGYSPADYRFWLLQSHYRTTANFTWDALEAAKQGLIRLRRLVYEELGGERPSQIDEKYINKFVAAISDDLDTPKALAILADLAKDNSVSPANKLATIHSFDSLLSLGLSKNTEDGLAELGIVQVQDLPDEILLLLSKRENARVAKDFAESDRLRDLLKEKGFEVKDTSKGQEIIKL